MCTWFWNPPPLRRNRAGPRFPAPHLFVASAPTEVQLDRIIEDLGDFAKGASEDDLARAATTLRLGRAQHAHRAHWLVDGPGGRIRPARRSAPATDAAPRLAFLFPGQGVQYAGMAGHLYAHEPVFTEHIDACAAILRPVLGIDIRGVISGVGEVDPGLLESTRYAQPTLFAVMSATARMLRSWGLEPELLAGHSLGEIVAATQAGVFELEDALRFTAARGAAMAACAPGGMLAVYADEAAVRRDLPPGLVIAAVNGSEAVVVAGGTDTVASYARECAERGVHIRLLPSNRAFHSPSMLDAREDLAAALRHVRLRVPDRPVYSGLTGGLMGEESCDPGYWLRQAVEPVRFAQVVDALRAVGCGALVECGPGGTLGSLVLRAAGSIGCVAAPIPSASASAEAQHAAVLTALGGLWQAGVEIDWSRVGVLGRARRVSLPGYPFDRRRHWVAAPEPGAAMSRPGIGAEEHARLAVSAERPGQGLVLSPGWSRVPDCAVETNPSTTPPGRTAALYVLPGTESEALAAQAGLDGVRIRPGSRFARLGPDEFVVDPERPQDHRSVFDLLAAEGRPIRDLLWLWSAAPVSDGRVPRAETSGLPWLLHAYQGWRGAHPGARGRLTVVGRGAFQVTGVEEIEPARSGLPALVTVLAQEDRLVDACYLDLDASSAPDRVAAALRGGLPRVSAVRGRHLWCPDLQAVRPPAPLPVAEGEVWVLIGGLGRLGLTIARALAGRRRPRIVLAGRSLPPGLNGAQDASDPTATAVRELEAFGAQVIVTQVDVTSDESVESLFARAEAAFGRIDQVIHLAGVTGERALLPLAEATWPRFEAVTRSKQDGVEVLGRVLRDRDFQRCVLFSSSSAVIGGLGLGPYACANAYLDAYATARRQAGDNRWLSIGWDAWAGAADGWRTWSETGAQEAEIPVRSALAVLEALIGQRNMVHAIVARPGFANRYRDWTQPANILPEVAGSDVVADRGTGPESTDPFRDVSGVLAGIWAEVLGVPAIAPGARFRDLGGDSLAATRVAARIRERFALEVPLPGVLKARTLADLASVVQGAADRSRAGRERASS
jgi:phthiocerol/phenolphthiocerol synthesis type-I polyketide synthase E